MTELTVTPPALLPAALAELHRATPVGRRIQVRFAATTDATLRADVAEGAGFAIVRGSAATVTTLERRWSLPDTVGPGMRLLVSGLNPSPGAADAGVGFARPGNRYWPAALAAGLVTRDRDPDHALHHHGVGMTDIVKRTTRRADELGVDEYRRGIARLDRTVARLQPRAVCFVGLAGWRAAVDRSAMAGWQEAALGGRPVYVMPSTSGLNASSSLADLADHLRLAASVPPSMH
jgi:TDG/mug DNA glycosylase family protein